MEKQVDFPFPFTDRNGFLEMSSLSLTSIVLLHEGSKNCTFISIMYYSQITITDSTDTF